MAVVAKPLQFTNPFTDEWAAYEKIHWGKDEANRAQFGTAGIRGKMEPGWSNMNDLIVIQTSQGLCTYASQFKKNDDGKPIDPIKMGVVIGYDGRRNSKRWAEFAAVTFAYRGMTVHLFSRCVPTPYVAFAVKELGCLAGIMVTASHNPKNDNGYKVYWHNTAQIISPRDAEIAVSIKKELKPWLKDFSLAAAGDTKTAPTVKKVPSVVLKTLISDPYERVQKAYVAMSTTLCFHHDDNKAAQPIVYTAMHGVGAPYSKACVEAFGLPTYIPVAEQIEIDPDFSTVPFPNPEEDGALARALATAARVGAKVIVANDPDADRMAAAEFDPATREAYILSGNEIGALLADWMWTNYKAKHTPEECKKCVMVASTVSSKFIKAMAEKEGFGFHDTLTGFKWMGNKAYELIKKGHTFLFAYEVEIGFLLGDASLDKDGVRACAAFAEMAHHWASQGLTLRQRLKQLAETYGFFEMTTGYFIAQDAKLKRAVFSAMRHNDKDLKPEEEHKAEISYPKACGEFKISHVRDVTRGFDDRQPKNVALFPAQPDQDMITYYLENGADLTIRCSGTEPKVKYYVEFHDKTPEAARKVVDEITAAMIKTLLQPERFQLKARGPPASRCFTVPADAPAPAPEPAK